MGVFAAQSPGFSDDLLLVDSTPVPCAQSRETSSVQARMRKCVPLTARGFSQIRLTPRRLRRQVELAARAVLELELIDEVAARALPQLAEVLLVSLHLGVLARIEVSQVWHGRGIAELLEALS